MITPASYIPFRDDEECLEKCAQWGLVTAKAKAAKKDYLYKGANGEEQATLVGYLESVFAVIKLASGRYHSIHPAFLKEMQGARFIYPSKVSENTSGEEQPAEEIAEPEEIQAVPVKQAPAEKTKRKPVDLPDGKVALKAIVDRFETKYDPFTQGEMEVIIFSNMSWEGSDTDGITAWSSYSATLKKAELAEGDQVTLEGKLADKKLNNDIRIKVNNAAKIEKV
jgi:hypothetical protein